MIIAEIRKENYIPRPGDEILSSSKIIQDGYVIEEMIRVKRPGLADDETLVYQPDPSGARDPESGEAMWGWFPGGKREKPIRYAEKNQGMP